MTVHALGITGLLRRSLRTTNAIEALHGQMRAKVRRVSRFVHGAQAFRWAVTAALATEERLYRIAGYRQLPVLAQALLSHVQRLQEAKTQAS